MFTHALPRLLALALTLAVVAPPVLAVDTCTAQATAHVDGTSSFGLGTMAMTFEQTADLARVSEGPGVDGDWVVTDWTLVTTMPMPAPVGSAMFAVPEWEATCSATQITPMQYKHHCTGEIPLVVENGAIAWTAGGAAIGAITGGAGDLPADMTLNILPNEGGFDWTMGGKLAGAKSPKLGIEVTGARYFYLGGTKTREFSILITVTPPRKDWINNLVGEIGYARKDVGPIIKSTGKTAAGRTYVIWVVSDSQSLRAKTIAASKVIGTLFYDTCDLRKTWPLDKLIYAYGHKP